jgi:hypothetical protein
MDDSGKRKQGPEDAGSGRACQAPVVTRDAERREENVVGAHAIIAAWN